MSGPSRARTRVTVAPLPSTPDSALCGVPRKNEAWLNHTLLQGDTFIPICHEVGDRQGAQANDLLDKI